MKKIIVLLAFALTMSLSAQTPVELSGMTGDLTLGNNCGNGEYMEFITYGDANLNGYTLTIRNAKLTITGNLNGGGKIKTNCKATFCVNGSIQNQVDYKDKDLNCETLSNSTAELELRTYDYSRGVLTIKDAKYIAIYNMVGQKVLEANRNTLDLTYIQKNIYIIRASNDKASSSFKLAL